MQSVAVCIALATDRLASVLSTKGSGDDEPHWPVFRFDKDNFHDAAKMDMHRIGGDHYNIVWKDGYYNHLPDFTSAITRGEKTLEPNLNDL